MKPRLQFRRLLPVLTIPALLGGVTAASAQTPILHYNFDDLADPTADLGSGTAAPGDLQGSAIFTTSTPGGFSAGALDLNGGAEGSRLSAGDIDKTDGLSAFTLTLWVNLQAQPVANDRLISERNAASPPDTEGYFDFTLAPVSAGTISATDLRLRLTIDVGPGGIIEFNTNNGVNLGVNRWVFLAVTYNGAGAAGAANDFFLGDETTAVAQLAQNGVGATDPAGGGTLLGNPSAFLIGDLDNFAGDRTPDALFDDVRVYNSVLTAGQLEAIRATNIPEPGSAALLLLGLGALGLRRRTDR